jgi:hypothetical protein
MLIHSAEITGSVQFNNTDVSGITNVSGFATTASVDALVVKTGSYATTSSVNELQSKTGSYTSTSSFDAYSSSINTFTSSATTRLNTIESVTGSFASTSSVNDLQSVTGSYASTGSNQFNGNQSISGSITSNGTITAQTLVVQTVTSSIEFVTGSTRNGSLLTNTHEFTGSVSITGSAAALLSVNNDVLYVSSSGNIGIGVTSISPISTYKTLEIRGATGGGIKIGKTGFNPLNIQHDGTDAYLNNVANGSFNIYTNDSPRLTIASTGAATFSSTVTATGFEGEFGQVLASVAYGGTTISKNLAELDPGAYLIHAYMMRGGDGVNLTYSVLWYYMHLSGFGGGSDYITALYSNPGPQNNNGRIALTGGYTVEITWGGARGPAAVTALKLRDGY